MLVGHKKVVESLDRYVPSVFLLSGPPSVGKRLIALSAAKSKGVASVDFMQVDRLHVEDAINLRSFMTTSAMKDLRFASIDLDDASKPALDRLLLLLENPPPKTHFALLGSKAVPRTIQTRSQVFNIGLLRPTELSSILKSKGLPVNVIDKVCNFGRVDLAMQAYSDISVKAAALNVLTAVQTQDRLLLMESFKAVDDKSAFMILSALQEAAAGVWTMFTPEQLGPIAQKGVALKLLAAWSSMASARPQLAVRVVFESILRG